MRTNVLSRLILIGAALAAPVAAQVGPAAESTRIHMTVGGTYAPARFSQTNGSSFWMQGGGVQSQFMLGERLGLVTDARMYSTSNINSTGVSLSFMTVTVGPRYTLPIRRNMVAFGQGLFGGAIAYNGLFPHSSGLQTTSGGLGIIAGGGMEMRLTNRMTLRAIEVDRMRTHLPNGVSDTQNALVIGGGIVYWLK